MCVNCYNYERRNSRLVPISKRGKQRGIFVGMTRTTHSRKYAPQIRYNGRTKHLGVYETEVKAAQKFDFVSRILGRTRRLNFPLAQPLPKFNIPVWIQSINIFVCLFFQRFFSYLQNNLSRFLLAD